MATFGELIHGRKAEFAPLHILDPTDLLRQMLGGEIQDWPQIQQIGDLFQNYMVSGIENLVPNFSDLLKEGGTAAQTLLDQALPLERGEIPEDVRQQVYRSGAFQSLGAGTAGSPMSSALTARDLGLTSLDLMKQGAGLAEAGGNAAQRWAGLASGTMLNPQSQMYSPEWFAQFRQQQETAKTASKQLRYNLAAQPDPAWADRAKMFANILGMVGGGGMGGGGGLGGAIGSGYAANAAALGGAGGMGGPGMGLGGGYPASYSPYSMQSNLNPGLGQNPGFLSNFMNSYNSTSPTNTGQGFGGMLGNWLGGIFNAG
jgi:hypothetical protein